MPRLKLQDYTWVHAHVRQVVRDTVGTLAETENRSVSNMVGTLLIEVLEARGVAIPQRGHEAPAEDEATE